MKAVSKLPDVAIAQTLSYLKATGLQRALLINFGEKRLVDGVKRISLWLNFTTYVKPDDLAGSMMSDLIPFSYSQ